MWRRLRRRSAIRSFTRADRPKNILHKGRTFSWLIGKRGQPSRDRPFKSPQNSGRTCRTRTTCRPFLLETGIMLCAPRLALAWWGQGCFTRESARLMARVLSDEKLAELMAKCFAHCKFLETIVLHVLHVLPLSLQVAKRPTIRRNLYT